MESDGVKIKRKVQNVVCRPTAFPSAYESTQSLYRFFCQQFVSQNLYGNIDDFVCDFVEDENGLVYFLKIKSYSTAGL